MATVTPVTSASPTVTWSIDEGPDEEETLLPAMPPLPDVTAPPTLPPTVPPPDENVTGTEAFNR
jgi:hypothetical protein